MTKSTLRATIGLLLAVAIATAFGIQAYGPQAAETAGSAQGKVETAATEPEAGGPVPGWIRLVGQGVGIDLQREEGRP